MAIVLVARVLWLALLLLGLNRALLPLLSLLQHLTLTPLDLGLCLALGLVPVLELFAIDPAGLRYGARPLRLVLAPFHDALGGVFDLVLLHLLEPATLAH